MNSDALRLLAMYTLCLYYEPLARLIIILSIPTLAVISYAPYNLFFRPLSGIPGPIGARTGLLSWKSTRAVKLDMVYTFSTIIACSVLQLKPQTGLEVTRAAREIWEGCTHCAE